MALSSLFQGSVSALACTPTSFHYPEILGATFLSVETNLVSNYSGFITHFDYGSHQNVNLANVSFYNVMVSYTRLGQNNNIHSQVWLPLDNWNGRMQGMAAVDSRLDSMQILGRCTDLLAKDTPAWEPTLD